MTLENPPGFGLRTDAAKAASDHGFRLAQPPEPAAPGWLAYRSTTAHGTLRLAAVAQSGPWFLALDHPGVIAELGLPPDPMPGPGLARYRLPTLTALYPVLRAVYRLALTLPDAPLVTFEAQTATLPKTTEAERLVVQRIGQDIFRAALLTYWHGRCPLTGITDPDLLRASHIKPWSACETDAERLDVHNGLLLSALWDAAFDKGLVTFADDGTLILSDRLTTEARAQLVPSTPSLPALTGATALGWPGIAYICTGSVARPSHGPKRALRPRVPVRPCVISQNKPNRPASSGLFRARFGIQLGMPIFVIGILYRIISSLF